MAVHPMSILSTKTTNRIACCISACHNSPFNRFNSFLNSDVRGILKYTSIASTIIRRAWRTDIMSVPRGLSFIGAVIICMFPGSFPIISGNYNAFGNQIWAIKEITGMVYPIYTRLLSLRCQFNRLCFVSCGETAKSIISCDCFGHAINGFSKYHIILGLISRRQA